MKRSLTIGCVLLVGGGVTNCGGSVEMVSTPPDEQGAHAGASGSDAGLGVVVGSGGHGGSGPVGFVGDSTGRVGVGGAYPDYAGSGNVYVGTPVEVGAGAGGDRQVGGAVGDAGAGGDAGDWEAAGEGGMAGAVGVAPPRGGTGGAWIGIPVK